MLNSKNRVVQLIDSLEPGGAEKMAVNYANALVDYVGFSGLITTRKEGMLKDQLVEDVNYFYLKKKSNLDINAFLKFRRYIKINKITHIHAHSSSFFWATLLKLTMPKLKLIWHDHYGNSEFLSQRNSFSLKLSSLFFHNSIAVNEKLLIWAKEKLYCKNNIYLPNFSILDTSQTEKKTILKGIQDKRIVCLANLRPQKNHFFLIEIAKRIKEQHPDWTFHLIGKDFEDQYSEKIKKHIKTNSLEKSVFVYGAKNDVANILSQSDIGILTSESEGLPVALIEYGFSELPIVTTDVGQISSVVEYTSEGFVVPSNDLESFSSKLELLINDFKLRKEKGLALKEKVVEKFSKEAVLKKYLTILD